MVSDKPPRRSKSDKSPVTIDLAADEVSTIATPVRSDDSDAPVREGNKDAKISDEKVAGAKDDLDVPKAAPEKPTLATTGPQDSKPAHPKPETNAGAADSNVESVKSAETSKMGVAGGPATSAPTSPAPSATNNMSASGASAASKPFGAGSANTSGSGSGTSSASAKAGTNTTSAPAPAPAPAPAKQDAIKSPATSSLVAAGIVGGVVALILAGSMFYAGVIPGSASGSSSETTALQQQIDSLNQQLASSTAAIDALKANTATGGGAADSTAMTERLAALEGRIGETGSNTAAAEALTQRLAALEAKVDQPGREEAVAKALAASALKTAIDRGGPFTGELQAFSGIAGNDPAVTVLEKFAATGVPTASDLVQKFPQTAETMLNAAHQTDEQAGIGTRLLSSAMQMVKVRPVGNVEGDTPEAVVARMEDQLRKGNIKGATGEWNALPQPAKDASVAYKQMLDARIEVDGLVDNTLNRAISGASNAG